MSSSSRSRGLNTTRNPGIGSGPQVEGERKVCCYGYELPILTSWSRLNPSRRYSCCPGYGKFGVKNCTFFHFWDREQTEHENFVLNELVDKVHFLKDSDSVSRDVNSFEVVEAGYRTRIKALEDECSELRMLDKRAKKKLSL